MAIADHQPDSPFGCVVTWGPQLAASGHYADWRIHLCNHEGYADHEDHVCKCGALYVAEDEQKEQEKEKAQEERKVNDCTCSCHKVTVPGVVFCPECGKGAIA